MTSKAETVIRVTAQVYWDAQDPQCAGWAYRVFAEVEESGALDCDDPVDLMSAVQELAREREDIDEIAGYVGERKALIWRSPTDWRWL